MIFRADCMYVVHTNSDSCFNSFRKQLSQHFTFAGEPKESFTTTKKKKRIWHESFYPKKRRLYSAAAADGRADAFLRVLIAAISQQLTRVDAWHPAGLRETYPAGVWERKKKVTGLFLLAPWWWQHRIYNDRLNSYSPRWQDDYIRADQDHYGVRNRKGPSMEARRNVYQLDGCRADHWVR